MSQDPDKNLDSADTIVRSQDGTTPFEGGHSSDGALGQQVVADRYEILGLVGRGGMGNVYRVRDLELAEVVALKTLHQELAERESAIERFRAEVRLARRVTHRNVARTFDIGTADGLPFLTMEFIDGQSLEQLVRVRRRLDPTVVLEIAAEVAAGLGAAHGAGVIHQDLKPANVLLEKETRRVVISDFGIARARDAAGDGGGFAGTPAYMAPEQVQGVETLDGRADLYALGIMIFEMLSGQLPFHGPTPMATALARMLQPPPDIRDVADVPEELASIVGRLLSVDRNDRFADARTLRAAIAGVLGGTDTISPSMEMRALGSSEGGSAKTVAVLPLRMRGADTPEHLRDGLTEELIDELSMSAGLRVKPRGAVLKYRGDDVDPLHAGRQLGVQVVVEGSFRVTGDRLRVRLAAVSVAEGFQLWAQRFDGDPGDLFEVCGMAADAIADALTVERTDRGGDVLTDPVTIDLYMRARKLMWSYWHGDLSRALPAWEEVLQRAPDDPRVLAGAATFFARLAFDTGTELGAESTAARAEDYADRAIEAAPRWAEPHVALAVLHWNAGEFGDSMLHVERALELAPGHVDALTIGGKILLETGPIDDAIAYLEAACEIDPHAYGTRFELARARALLGKFDEADGLLSLEVEGGSHPFFREVNRTRVDLWRPRDPRWLDEPLPEAPESRREMMLFILFARETAANRKLPENFEALIQIADASISRSPRLAFLTYQVGCEFACCAGEEEIALELAEKAVDAGLLDLVWAEYCPVLAPIRDDARFQVLLEQLRARRERVMTPTSSAEETVLL